MRRLQSLSRGYEDREIPLQEYVRGLTGFARAPAPPAAYPQAHLLLELAALEKGLDHRSVEKEVGDFLRADKGTDARALSALAAQAAQVRRGSLNPRSFYESLLAAGGRPLPATRRYADYLRKREALETGRFLEELQALPIDLADRLLPRPAEDPARRLHRLDAWVGLKKRLWSLDMDPAAWSLYSRTAREESWAGVESSLEELERASGLLPPLPRRDDGLADALRRMDGRAEEFYALALRRNRALVDNALREARARGTDRVVLIAGGFHTLGLTRLLRREGLSYAVVLPQFQTEPAPGPLLSRAAPETPARRTLRKLSEILDPSSRQDFTALFLAAARAWPLVKPPEAPPVSVEDWRSRLTGEELALCRGAADPAEPVLLGSQGIAVTAWEDRPALVGLSADGVRAWAVGEDILRWLEDNREAIRGLPPEARERLHQEVQRVWKGFLGRHRGEVEAVLRPAPAPAPRVPAVAARPSARDRLRASRAWSAQARRRDARRRTLATARAIAQKAAQWAIPSLLILAVIQLTAPNAPHWAVSLLLGIVATGIGGLQHIPGLLMVLPLPKPSGAANNNGGLSWGDRLASDDYEYEIPALLKGDGPTDPSSKVNLYERPDFPALREADRLEALLKEGRWLEVKARLKSLAMDNRAFALLIRRLLRIRRLLDKGEVEKAEEQFQFVQSFSESLAARIYHLLDADQKNLLYYSSSANSAQTMGRLDFQGPLTWAHKSMIRRYRHGVKGALLLLDHMEAESASQSAEEDASRRERRLEQMVFLLQLYDRTLQEQALILEIWRRQLRSVHNSEDLPPMTDEEKRQFRSQVDALRKQLTFAARWRKNPPSLPQQREYLSAEPELLLPRLVLFRYPNITLSPEASHRQIDNFVTPLAMDQLRPIQGALLQASSLGDKNKKIQNIQTAMRRIGQSQRKPSRVSRGADARKRRSPLPAVNQDLSALAFGEWVLGIPEPSLDLLPHYEALLERVRNQLLGRRTSGLFVDSEELLAPVCRLLARRSIHDLSPELRKQKYLYVDFAETLRQTPDPDKALARFRDLIEYSETMENVTLVLGLEALRNYRIGLLNDFLNFWLSRDPARRPRLAAAATSYTRKAVLNQSARFQELFPESKADASAASPLDEADARIFQETAEIILSAKGVALAEPDIPARLYDKVCQRTPMAHMGTTLQLLEETVSRVALEAGRNGGQPRRLDWTEVEKTLASLPPPEEMPLQDRLYMLQGVMPPKEYKAVDDKLKEYNNLPSNSQNKYSAHRYLLYMLDYPWGNQPLPLLKRLRGLSDRKREAEKRKILREVEDSIGRSHSGIPHVVAELKTFVTAVIDSPSETISLSQLIPFLLFPGPPGTGKTTLSKRIADIFGVELVVVPMGGANDQSLFKGGLHTFLGSEPSVFLMSHIRKRTRWVLYLLDEIDKIVQQGAGNISAALLPLTERRRDRIVQDQYFQLPFDISQSIIVGTANYPEQISKPLRSRASELPLSGYSPAQMREIAARHFIPDIMSELGLQGVLDFDAEAVSREVVENYMNPADRGLRELKNILLQVATRRLRLWLQGGGGHIGREEVREALGRPKHDKRPPPLDRPGLVQGVGPQGHRVLVLTNAREPGPPAVELAGHWEEAPAVGAQTVAKVVRARLPGLSRAIAPDRALTAEQVSGRKLVLQILTVTPGNDHSYDLASALSAAAGFLNLPVALPAMACRGGLDADANVEPVDLAGTTSAAPGLGVEVLMLPFKNWAEIINQFSKDPSLRGLVHMTDETGQASLFIPFLEAGLHRPAAETDQVRAWNHALRTLAAERPPSATYDCGLEFNGDLDGLASRLPPSDAPMTHYLLVSTLDQAAMIALHPETARRTMDRLTRRAAPGFAILPPESQAPVADAAASSEKMPVAEAVEPEAAGAASEPSASLGVGLPLPSHPDKSLPSSIRLDNGEVLDLEELGREGTVEAQEDALKTLLEQARTPDSSHRKEELYRAVEALLRATFYFRPSQAGTLYYAICWDPAFSDYRDELQKRLTPVTRGHLLSAVRTDILEGLIETFSFLVPHLNELVVKLGKEDVELLVPEELEETKARILAEVQEYLRLLDEGLSLVAIKDHEKLKEARDAFEKAGAEENSLEQAFEALFQEAARVNSHMFNFISPKDPDQRDARDGYMDLEMESYSHLQVESLDPQAELRGGVSSAWAVYQADRGIDDLVEDGVLKRVAGIGAFSGQPGDPLDEALEPAYAAAQVTLGKAFFPIRTFVVSSKALQRILPAGMDDKFRADAGLSLDQRLRRQFIVDFQKLPSDPEEAILLLTDILSLFQRVRDANLWFNLDGFDETFQSDRDKDRVKSLLQRFHHHWMGMAQEGRPPIFFLANPLTQAGLYRDNSHYASSVSVHEVQLPDESQLLEFEDSAQEGPGEDWSEAFRHLQEGLRSSRFNLAEAVMALQEAAGKARKDDVKVLTAEDADAALAQIKDYDYLTRQQHYQRLINAMPDEPRREAHALLRRVEGAGRSTSQELEKDRKLLKDLVNFPWNTYSKPQLAGVDSSTPAADYQRKAMERLRQIENALGTHIGLKDIKEVLMDIAALRLHQEARGDRAKGVVVLGLGAAGVGKTSLFKSLAAAMDVPFGEIDIGAEDDPRFAKGFPRNVLNTAPGAFAMKMIEVGVLDPMLALDEVGKIKSSQKQTGDLTAPLLEVLDPEQNHSFKDENLGRLPLNRVTYLMTSNIGDPIPEAIMSRVQFELNFKPYARHEKVAILLDALARLMEQGTERRVRIPGGRPGQRALVECIIDDYTDEEGVRQSKDIHLPRILRIARNEGVEAGKPVELTPAKLRSSLYLGQPTNRIKAEKDPVLGQARALSMSEGQGHTHTVQTLVAEVPNAPFTGPKPMGEMDQEMASIMNRGYTYGRNWLMDRRGLTREDFLKRLHGREISAFVTPSDGTKGGLSAGVPLSVALVSRLSEFTGEPLLVRPNLAMTGVVDDDGYIYRVEGVEGKILAAARAKMDMIALPAGNAPEVHLFLDSDKSRDLYGVVDEGGLQTLTIPSVRPEEGDLLNLYLRDHLLDEQEARNRQILLARAAAGKTEEEVEVVEDSDDGITVRARREVMHRWLADHPDIQVPMTYFLDNHLSEVYEQALVPAPSAKGAAGAPAAGKAKPPRKPSTSGFVSLPALLIAGTGLPALVLGSAKILAFKERVQEIAAALFVEWGPTLHAAAPWILAAALILLPFAYFMVRNRASGRRERPAPQRPAADADAGPPSSLQEGLDELRWPSLAPDSLLPGGGLSAGQVRDLLAAWKIVVHHAGDETLRDRTAELASRLASPDLDIYGKDREWLAGLLRSLPSAAPSVRGPSRGNDDARREMAAAHQALRGFFDALEEELDRPRWHGDFTRLAAFRGDLAAIAATAAALLPLSGETHPRHLRPADSVAPWHASALYLLGKTGRGEALALYGQAAREGGPVPIAALSAPMAAAEPSPGDAWPARALLALQWMGQYYALDRRDPAFWERARLSAGPEAASRGASSSPAPAPEDDVLERFVDALASPGAFEDGRIQAVTFDQQRLADPAFKKILVERLNERVRQAEASGRTFSLQMVCVFDQPGLGEEEMKETLRSELGLLSRHVLPLDRELLIEKDVLVEGDKVHLPRLAGLVGEKLRKNVWLRVEADTLSAGRWLEAALTVLLSPADREIRLYGQDAEALVRRLYPDPRDAAPYIAAIQAGRGFTLPRHELPRLPSLQGHQVYDIQA